MRRKFSPFGVPTAHAVKARFAFKEPNESSVRDLTRYRRNLAEDLKKEGTLIPATIAIFRAILVLGALSANHRTKFAIARVAAGILGHLLIQKKTPFRLGAEVVLAALESAGYGRLLVIPQLAATVFGYISPNLLAKWNVMRGK